jgi:glycosyltransferase involved in cell wall biosynthesis
MASISILTPVWNGLPFIKESIDSVLSQDYQDWELIISDNGSNDGTREYLDTLKDPRIRVVKQEKNLGICGNLNFLLAQPSAPIACWLCADDYFHPGAVGRIVDEWKIVSPGTAFIGFNWKDALEHDLSLAYSYKILPKKMERDRSQLAFFLFGNLPGNISNVSFNVEILKSSGGFDETTKMVSDFEIWSRVAKKHTIVLSDTKTVFVRDHEGEASYYLNKQGKLFGEHVSLYEKLFEEVAPYHDRQSLINYFNIQICSFHLRSCLKAILHGQLTNFRIFMTTQSTLFWPKWKRLMICLPFALFENTRERILNRMVRKLMNNTY